MEKKALITGITGQDGAYLAELLIGKGYEVFGGTHRSSVDYTFRLKVLGVLDEVKLINMDLMDPINVFDIISKNQFDEIYNLASQSFVGLSWDMPIQTSQVNAMGPLYILDAIKKASPGTKFYQASTSEIFGLIQEDIQQAQTPLNPQSPYGIAKQFAHSMTVNYRESFGLHASSGILYNHESPLRGKEFVTKKITTQLAEIKVGKRNKITLGNLDAKRDWGFAKEYVNGMWMMLQQTCADDYILATGKATTVRKFVEYSAEALGLKVLWEGEGLTEKGIDKKSGNVIIEVSKEFFRPVEVNIPLGIPDKAFKKMSWKAKTTVKELAEMMAKFDYDLKIN